MESVGMRPYKCSEVKKKKEDLATHFNVMSLIHEIKASYVSNVVVKRCEEREKKDLERNFEHSVEKKKVFWLEGK